MKRPETGAMICAGWMRDPGDDMRGCAQTGNGFRAAMLVFRASAFGIIAAALGGAAQAQDCGGSLSAACIERLGAGAVAPAPGACEAELAAYRACLAEAVEQAAPAAPAVDASQDARAEAAYAAVAASGDPERLELVAQTYPDTFWGKLARRDAAALRKAAAEPAPRRAAGDSFHDCEACPVMVALPAGRFTMGSPSSEPGRDADEGPLREVEIRPVALSRTEVTRAAYRRFAEATGRAAATGCFAFSKAEGWGFWDAASWLDPGFPQAEDHPVVCVSRGDAEAFVAWLNAETGTDAYRLPSEAELEYAIRAGTRGAHPWGADQSRACAAANGADRTAQGRFAGWTVLPCADGAVFTAPAGSRAPNAFGLRDMSGNVWEWAADCWSQSYAGAPATGIARRTGDCAKGVRRGGAFDGAAVNLRAADRFWDEAGFRNAMVGIRVARDLGR